MDELRVLIKQNVEGDSSNTLKQVKSILDNNIEINSLITWIKINSVARNLKPEEVLSMAIKFKRMHANATVWRLRHYLGSALIWL